MIFTFNRHYSNVIAMHLYKRKVLSLCFVSEPMYRDVYRTVLEGKIHVPVEYVY